MTVPLTRGELVRLGFEDSEQALARVTALGLGPGDLMVALGECADPDGALGRLVEIAAADPDLMSGLASDTLAATRLVTIVGASSALADHLVRHPGQWHELADPTLANTRPTAFAIREALMRAVGADPGDPAPIATLPDADAVNTLRVEYRRVLLRLAARDLAHGLGVDDVAAELSDLAAATLDTALAIARARVGEAGAETRLSVIAMGKCGGHELNYVSDVDVLFVFAPAEGEAEGPALRNATQLATQMMQVCSAHTEEGTLWPVDAGLRPEGKAGSLVRTLASHRGYYERWAKTWEFQALLKARPVAGDIALGREFVEMVAPLVWSVAARNEFVSDVQAMRRRVLEHIPAKEAPRQLKLGSGGLRDVEFAVQLLQLVHGQHDASLHESATLSALAALTRGGYVGREDGERMHQAYAFLRTLEHRLQLHQLRRTHVVPDDPESLRRLGRSMGYLNDPVAALEKEWAFHRREVRRLHEKLFYRPLLSAVAQVPGDGARLTTDAAKQRLAALGYADPEAAMRHLSALTEGVSRTAAIQRTLLPVLLEWFADAPDPDAGLFGFRRISEALGRTPWYLQMLRDEGEVAQRLAAILATSRYATDLLEREPEGVRLLADSLIPLEADAIEKQMASAANRQSGLDEAIRSIRAIRRRELLRIAAGELVDGTDVADVGAGLSRLTDATLGTTLTSVMAATASQRELSQPPCSMAVVAMGRYGGFELSYGSDADVMFVYEPGEGVDAQQAASFAQAVVTQMRSLLAAAGTDPPLQVDADLRPEGKQGPLVRTLASYRSYYEKWSKVWEFQALLRADPVVGDPDLCAAFRELIDPLRFPAAGITDADMIEVRRIKARVDTERLPRGADPKTHLKLGRGGLADVEWTVQALQMRFAGQHSALRTPRTLEALHAARDAELISTQDAEQLEAAWRLVSRVRNAITLIRGRPSDQLPGAGIELAGVARLLGYAPGRSDDLVNDYLRTTRRAHSVVERIFW